MKPILSLLCFLYFSTGLKADINLQLKGKAIQGGFLIGIAPTAKKVFLDDNPLPITKKGKFILGFGRNYKRKARLKLETENGIKEMNLNITQRKYDVQAIDGIDEEKVTPPPWAWTQIRAQSKIKRQARKKLSSLLGWAQPFVWPIQGQITGIYGSQRVLNGKPKRPHYGIDIAAPAGSKVFAPADGIITLAANDFYFEGGLIFLDHGFGLSSAFLHLGELLVKVGQAVKQGEVIALSGNSGRSTGAHLDWRVKWHKQNLDPVVMINSANALTKCARGAFVRHQQAICYEAKANSQAAP